MYKNDIFNTTMGKVKDIKNLKKAIEFYLVANSNSSLFRDVVMPARTIFISGILPADREIPMFSLPVIINDIKKESLIVVDLRSVLKSKLTLEEARDTKIKDLIKNETDYTFKIIRAVLMGDVLTGDFLRLNTIADDLANSFAIWISSVITSNYGLVLSESVYLKIALLYHYYALMSKNDIDKTNIRKVAANITKHFSNTIDLKFVEETLECLEDDFDKMNPKTAYQLVSNIKTIMANNGDKSDKLSNISDISLLQLLLNSWFGDNSNETVALSLEHPPTFAAMCYLALNNNSYRLNKLATILDSRLKNKKVFADNLKNILTSTNYK